MIHPQIPDKTYFQIGEVAELAQVEDHVLRYWEQQFSVLRPKKRQSGHRLYTKKDIEIIYRIKELLYEEKFTIAGAKKRIWYETHRGGKPESTVAAQKIADDAGEFDVRELCDDVEEMIALLDNLKK